MRRQHHNTRHVGAVRRDGRLNSRVIGQSKVLTKPD
jgi:hypothetical protein